MAFDACMMRAVLWDFSTRFADAKIEKVLQPRNDEIDLIIHSGKNTARLLFNVGPNAPRLQLTDIAKENPIKAPMFCMLLRKHLTGGKVFKAEQLGFDRIAVFSVAAYDEMGYPCTKKIVCEIMGKYANLIILDGDDRILAALKTVDFSESTVRQVLPGLKYQIPEIKEKLSPLIADKDSFACAFSKFDKEKTLERFVTSTYSGIATQIARELSYRATGATDTRVGEIDSESFYSVFSEWQNNLINHCYTPTVAMDKSGKPTEYAYTNISYLENKAELMYFDSFCSMFDLYFAEKDRIERIHQRAHDLVTLINNAKARTERKLAIQRQTLIDSEKGEEYKKHGDIITANLYKLTRGMESFVAVDYYDEACPDVEIKLDTKLSPSQNAQKMYKLYAKSKRAKEVLAEQIENCERELLYLESVEGFLEKAETEEDLSELREELYRSGYSSKMKDYRSPKKMRLVPIRYETSGGFTVLVGRNNVQNDNLTFKIASKSDIWFHTKDIPGSHVILLSGGEEPSERDYTEAASIAAYHSKATADTVAVDYTYVKNIKKPQGAKPGFVIYKTNYTAFVRPMKKEDLKRNG